MVAEISVVAEGNIDAEGSMVTVVNMYMPRRSIGPSTFFKPKVI